MEQMLNEVKGNVQKKFNEIRGALHMREKLLLRQLEVIANTQQQMKAQRQTVQNDGEMMSFISGKEEEEQLLAAIRSFGHFHLDNNNMQLALQEYRNTGLRNEDYIEPVDDHETMYKCLQDGNIAYELEDGDEPVQQAPLNNNNKKCQSPLIEENANAKRSIINITLQEAKDLIRKAKIKREEIYIPPLNLEELDDELESSIADAVSSLGRDGKSLPNKPTKPRKPRFKPKITINNCNGTINLRNIASLTINCAQEEAVSAEIPLAQPSQSQSVASAAADSSDQTSTSTSASSSNSSSNASSRSQSKKQKPKPTQEATNTSSNSFGYDEVVVEHDTHDVTCDFYNRLLDEIKKSMKEKPRRVYTAAADSSTTEPPQGSSTNTSTSDVSKATPHLKPGKRLILKNFENLKIILEANSGDEDSFHPVQIEQWLAEIISETDLEPIPNTDILEHSQIHNSESI